LKLDRDVFYVGNLFPRLKQMRCGKRGQEEARGRPATAADPFGTLRANSAAITLAELMHHKRLMMYG
jgi:hypothetical protein